MSKKIIHEQIRKITQKYLLNSGESYLIDLGNQIINYITQQEKLENELDNTIIISNSRLERLNGLELEYDKQEKLLELYKKLHNKYRYPTWQDDEYVKEIEKQIKELENEFKNIFKNP